jgi:hypothetical protein
MIIKPSSPWKWVQLARQVRTKTPAQHHVLLVLAQYANQQGTCWPSYENLMQETRFGSRNTIVNALTYLRDELKILEWKPGHGNQYKHFANTYTFSQDAMVALLRAQKPKTDEST